jgi:hypothetical protein
VLRGAIRGVRPEGSSLSSPLPVEVSDRNLWFTESAADKVAKTHLRGRAVERVSRR